MLNRWCVVLAGAALLAACSRPAAPPGAAGPPASAEASAPARSNRLEVGLAAYTKVCARCHEDGANGAPVVGRPEDWAKRSRLWQAVLAEHAERGYIRMPAKGGDSTLSDEEVRAAAEYLLTRTRPQAPVD